MEDKKLILKNNQTEIEGKYLVKEIPPYLYRCEKNKLIQGYISTMPELRIRKNDDIYVYTEKGDGTVVRPEKNEIVSYELGNEYFNKVESNFISKTRYKLNLSNGFIAELDIYDDQFEGLFIVEVEFETLEEYGKFIKPFWFGEEISENKRYKNKNLAYLTEKEAKELVNRTSKPINYDDFTVNKQLSLTNNQYTDRNR